MKITKIGYGYTQSLGNYDAAKLYAEVEVTLADGSDPAIAADKAYQDLKDWIHDRMPDEDKIQDRARDLNLLLIKISSALGQIRRLRLKWIEVSKVLASHGIKVKEKFPWKPEAPEPPIDSLSLAFPPREDNYESLAFPLREDDDDGYEDPDEYI